MRYIAYHKVPSTCVTHAHTHTCRPTSRTASFGRKKLNWAIFFKNPSIKINPSQSKESLKSILSFSLINRSLPLNNFCPLSLSSFFLLNAFAAACGHIMDVSDGQWGPLFLMMTIVGPPLWHYKETIKPAASGKGRPNRGREK